MMSHLTVAGPIHVVLALICTAVGLIQFLRPKRGAGHRARGYFYVYAMLVSDGVTLLLYQFSGRFSMFHAAAITNLACIMLAIVPLLRSPRPANWRTTHYYFIAWSYVSLMSAAAINIMVRLLPLTNRGQIGWTALVVSIVVMMIAYVVIGKCRPLPDATAGPTKLAERSGVTS
jgi:uncharacterized membrane protein